MTDSSLQKTIANRVERRIRGLENADFESSAFVNSILASAIMAECSNDCHFGFTRYQGTAEHDFGYLDKILVNYEVFIFEKSEDLSRFSKENGTETSLEINGDKVSISVKLLLTREESSVQQVKDEISYYVPELLGFLPFKKPVIKDEWYNNAEKVLKQMENCPDSEESIRFSCASSIKEMYLNRKWGEVCNGIENDVITKLEKHYNIENGRGLIKRGTTVEEIAKEAINFAVTDERLSFLDVLQKTFSAQWNNNRKTYKRIPNDYSGELTVPEIQELSENVFKYCIKFLENRLVGLITDFDFHHNHLPCSEIRRIVLQTGVLDLDKFFQTSDETD